MISQKNINCQFSIFNFQAILCLLGLFLVLSSCEQTVENPELPFKEQLVVRAVLEAGEVVRYINITKTLHPLEEYDLEKALVKDAVAVIKSEGKEFPLVYNGDYYAALGLIPESGKKYTLEVKWKDIVVTSSTIVPEPVEIDTLYYTISKVTYDWGDTEWICNVIAEFKPKNGAVYTASAKNDFESYKNYMENIHRFKDTLSNGKIAQTVLQINSFDSSDAVSQLYYYTCFVDSYDIPFYNYFITRWEGSSGDDIFGTSGLNVRGNINNGIGLFIGTASTSKRINF